MSKDIKVTVPVKLVIDKEKLQAARAIWEEVEDAQKRYAIALKEAVPSVIDITTKALQPAHNGYLVTGDISVDVSDPWQFEGKSPVYAVNVSIAEWAIENAEAEWKDGQPAYDLRQFDPDEARVLAYALLDVANRAEQMTMASDEERQ